MAKKLLSLAGHHDAMALLGVGAGMAAAHPMLTGNPLALGMAAAPFASGMYLAKQFLSRKLDKVDTASREDFILKSDDLFPVTQGLDGLRIGQTRDGAMPVDIDNDSMMRHSAIIGQSGVGKTVLGTYLLWQQMVRGGGWIFIDAKLDEGTRNELSFMASMLGRQDDFYVLNVDDPSSSNTYNPLLEGDPDEVASRLLNLIPSAETSPGADYFRQSANQALTVLIGALQAAKHRYHFADLAILMQSDQAMERVERMVPPGNERMAVQIFLNQFRKRTKEGTVLDVDKIKTVLGGIAGRIAGFSQGKFGEVFNTYTPEIDLTDIILKNKFLYVMLPTMGKPDAAFNLGKMILSDLRTAVYKVQGLPKPERPWPPYLVFADEMGSYVMPSIKTLFEQARSAHICMLPAFQSFANLTSVSPDFADMIIQNTWNKYFFKFGSESSSETAAETIGKELRYSYTVTKGESQGNSAQSLRATPESSMSNSGSLGESWKASEEFRVTTDQLKALGKGQSIVVSGARMFHVNIPMLSFPKVDVFRVIRHPSKVPKDESVLNFAEIYREFLMSNGDVTQPARSGANTSEPS